MPHLARDGVPLACPFLGRLVRRAAVRRHDWPVREFTPLTSTDPLREGWNHFAAGEYTEAIAIALLDIAESLRQIGSADLNRRTDVVVKKARQ